MSTYVEIFQSTRTRRFKKAPKNLRGSEQVVLAKSEGYSGISMDRAEENLRVAETFAQLIAQVDAVVAANLYRPWRASEMIYSQFITIASSKKARKEKYASAAQLGKMIGFIEESTLSPELKAYWVKMLAFYKDPRDKSSFAATFDPSVITIKVPPPGFHGEVSAAERKNAEACYPRVKAVEPVRRITNTSYNGSLVISRKINFTVANYSVPRKSMVTRKQALALSASEWLV